MLRVIPAHGISIMQSDYIISLIAEDNQEGKQIITILDEKGGLLTPLGTCIASMHYFGASN